MVGSFVACESGLMHEGAAQIISDVGLVYERSFVMAWIALFSVIDLGRGVSLPCCEHISLVQSLRQFSRRGVWATTALALCTLRIHGWSAGRDSITLAGNGAVFAVEYPVSRRRCAASLSDLGRARPVCQQVGGTHAFQVSSGCAEGGAAPASGFPACLFVRWLRFCLMAPILPWHRYTV
jgi:hypothetical protein